MTKSALAVWDFTLSVRRSTDDHLEIIKELNQLAKRWNFQLEDARKETLEDCPSSSDEDETNDYSSSEEDIPQGFEDIDDLVEATEDNPDNDDNIFDLDEEEYAFRNVEDESSDYDSDYDSDASSSSESDNYLHYQGKISLFKRKRLSELKALVKANDFWLSKAHFSPSSNNGLGDVFYTCKIDTQIKGPWSDRDEPEIPMPRQLKHIKELFPWQQEIIDRSKYCWDSRKINILYDEVGCSGKSTLVTWCKIKKILNCKTVPCILNSFLDLNQAVMSQPVGGLYFIDMPRSLPKNKLNEFMAFIETLKSGYVYDTRYKYTERFFDSPAVWIFCNIKLPLEMLSRDRWKIYNINENKELVLYPSGEKDTEIEYPIEKVEEEVNDEKLPIEEENKEIEEVYSCDESDYNIEQGQVIELDNNVILGNVVAN